MEDGNQAGETPTPPGPRDPDAEFAAWTEGPPEPVGPPVRRGMLIWLVALMPLGIGAAVLGVQELAALIAFAGIFIAAQAADVNPRWFAAYLALGGVVPLAGAATFVFLAKDILDGDAPQALRIAGATFAILSAFFSLFTLRPAVARGLVRLMFRTDSDSHALRLAARVVSLTLLFVFPAALVVPHLLEPILERPGGLFEPGPLGGELLGYVVLALASVGFLIRRDLRQTLERLGLRAPRLGDLGLIVAGTGALFALNAGADWIQHRLFPGSWAQDRHVNEELVRGLTTRAALLLGVTAGIGEEITLRGALQPRLGIVLTSLLFAALHVQYSWFGMLTILVIGLVLGTLRQRAGTTVAMAVHAIYDVLAVFTT